MTQSTRMTAETQLRWCMHCSKYKRLRDFSPANSWCKACKAEYKRSKYVAKSKPSEIVRCSYEGCGQVGMQGVRIVDGLCNKHYQVRWVLRNPELAAANAKRRVLKDCAKTTTPAIKGCPRCMTEKPFTEFRKDLRRFDNLTSWCSICEKEYFRSWNLKRNPSIKKAQTRKWHLKTKFNLTPYEYDDMFEAQDKKCAACGRSEDKMQGLMMAVDHDHVTGQIRGILCSGCNSGIGMFDDDPDKLMAAAAYLFRFTDVSS